MITNYLPKTQIVLPTNGSLVNEEAVKKLCGIPTLKIINFSINAFYDETYEKFMGLKASNIAQIEQAIKLIKILRPDISSFPSMVFDPQYQSDLERDNFYRYWAKIGHPQIISAASASRSDKIPCQPLKIPCRSIFSDIVIGYDGKLSSCCFDAGFVAYDLGFYSGDLKRDWLNPQFQEFRRIHNEHRREEIPLCKQCTFS